jgi:hypothetical protein
MIDFQLFFCFLSLYTKAVWKALSNPWFDYIENDSVSGNGFQIVFYGIKLIFIYLSLFIFRLVIFILFPISGFVFMWVDSENKKYNKKMDEKYKNDPNFDI